MLASLRSTSKISSHLGVGLTPRPAELLDVTALPPAAPGVTLKSVPSVVQTDLQCLEQRRKQVPPFVRDSQNIPHEELFIDLYHFENSPLFQTQSNHLYPLSKQI